MRNYIQKHNLANRPDSLQQARLGAGEINSFLNELTNCVTSASLTAAPSDGSGEDATQLSQSMFINGVSASRFIDAGSANTIQISPATGSSGLKLPPDITSLNGGTFEFIANATNTGATTVQIGQDAGGLFSPIPLLGSSGAPLSGGEIIAGQSYRIWYDATGPNFKIISTENFVVNGGSGDVENLQQVLDTNVPWVFDDIAALRLNTQGLTVSRILGATTAGDGGEAIYWLDPADTTSADDGVAVIVDASGNRWKRQSVAYKMKTVLDYIPAEYHAAILAGTNATDLTTYIQNAFDDNAGRQVFFPTGGPYIITGPLQSKLSFPYFADSAQLVPQGSGYVALTLSDLAGTASMGGRSTCRIRIGGAGAAVDGLVIINPQGMVFDDIEVTDVVGSGVHIYGGYDCIFTRISCLRCGTASKYAFELTEFEGTPTNQCVFTHIQCELANELCLLIPITTIFCTFNHIHAERINCASDLLAFSMGGDRSSFRSVRVNFLNVFGYASFGNNFEAETVQVENQWVEYNPQLGGIRLRNVNIAELRPSSLGEQTGRIVVEGGVVGTFRFQAGTCSIRDLNVAALIFENMTGSAPGNELAYLEAAKRRFENCIIADITASSTNAAAHFASCQIAARTSWPRNVALSDIQVVPVLDPPSGATLWVDNCRTDNVTVTDARVDMSDTQVAGNFTASGTRAGIFRNNGCNGTVSAGVGGEPTAGYYFQGQITYPLAPTVGSPVGYVCTASGTIGGTAVFTPLANL